MNAIECPREQDVLDAIAACRWPARCGEDLRAHVAQCPVCADLASVASALGDDHDWWWQQARVPSASLVWWRSEMRARTEAARVVSRPVLIAQVVSAMSAMACALGWLALAPAGGCVTATLDTGLGWMASALGPWVASATSGGTLALWLGAGTWLLLVPAAIYFAVRE